MKLNNKTILITSNEPWGDMWFSKQHYANELSKLNHKVYFVNPLQKWKFKNLFSLKVKIEDIETNLCLLSYKNNFPLKLFPKLFTRINDRLNERKIVKAIQTKEIIWWKFDPYRFLRTQYGKTIYHVVDTYMWLWQDAIISKYANLVVCTSPKYVSHYSSKGLELMYVPHGVSSDEIKVDVSIVNNLKNKYKDFALIIGTMNNDYDMDLIYSIAEGGIHIIILGEEKNNDKKWKYIKKHSNVEYIGVVHAKELKNYIAASKVCLNPYDFELNKTSEFRLRSPLKILNYLAQKKPVITSIDSEIEELESCVIYTTKHKEEFLEYVKKGIDDKLIINNDKIEDYLSKHNYSILINKILVNL